MDRTIAAAIADFAAKSLGLTIDETPLSGRHLIMEASRPGLRVVALYKIAKK